MDTPQPLRIGLVSGPMVAIPPPGYAGTERIVAVLVDELVRRGHLVTLIGPGDSQVNCELIPTISQALWSSGMKGDNTPYIQVTIEKAYAACGRFDVIHSHLDTLSFSFARHCPTPVVHTLHGRLDVPGVPELLDEFRDIPLVAISESQRRWWPHSNWVATVHHGLPLEQAPFSRPAGQLPCLRRANRARKGSRGRDRARAPGAYSAARSRQGARRRRDPPVRRARAAGDR